MPEYDFSMFGKKPEKEYDFSMFGKPIEEPTPDATYLEELETARKIGFLETEWGQIKGKTIFEGITTPEGEERVKAIKDEIKKITIESKRKFYDPAQILLGTAKLTPLMEQSLIKGAEIGLPMALGAGAMGAISGVATAPLAGIGYKMGQVYGSAKFMAYAEGGLAYDEMKELGIDDKYAIPISQGVGIINAGIEFSQISMILRTIPGLRKIVSRGLGFGVKEIVKEKLPKALGKVGIDYAKFLAGELGQEEAQEIVTILGTEFAKDLSNKIEDTDLTKATSEEIVNRLTETFKGSLGLMVMGIPGTSAQVVTEITSNIANKNAQKTQTEIAEILGEEPTEIIPPTTEIPPEVTPPVEIVPEVTPEIVPEAKKEVVEPPIIEEPTKVIPEVKEPVKKPEIEKRTSEDLQIEMAIEEAKEERYRHKPLTEKEGWARLDNLIPAFGKDIYTENAVQYFGTGEKVFDNKTVSILQAVRDMPEKEIKIYRAIEKGEPKSIKSGDWVTVNKEYATEHGETILDGKYEIAEKLVKVKDLTTSADSINEQGYYPIKPTPVEKAVEKKPPKKKRIVKKPTGRIQIKIPKEFDRARIPYLDYALGFQTSDEDFKDYYVGIQPLYKKDAPAFDTVTEELKDLAPDLYYATKEGDTELFKEKVFQDLMKLEKPEVEEGVLSISEEIAELKKKAIRTVGLDLEKGEKISWIDEDTGEIHKGTVIETVEEKGIAKIENDDTHKVDDFDVIYLVEREKPPKVEKKPEVVKEEKPKVKEKIKVYPVSEVKEFITKHKKELVRGQNLLLKNEKLETMLNDAYKKEGVTPSKAEYGNHLGKIFWNRKLGKSDLTTKDKNAKYKEVFEEPKYRIGIEKFKSADIKEIENILYKATGTRNITTVPEIIEKKNALGKYYNGMIEVAKTGDMKVTAYHETYHFVEDLLMTDKEVAQAERFEKSAEKRAEGFVEYVKDITTYRGKLKNFFVKLWRKLKNFMRSKHNIENIYDKILKGYYKERAILPSGEILKRVKEKIAEPKYKEPAITDKQRKTIYAIADEIDLDYDEVHIVLKQLTDKESLNDLAQDEYKNFIASLKSFKKQIDEGFRYYDEETEQVKEETKERIDKIQQYSEKSGEDKAKAKIETSEELKDNINESIARKEKKLTTAKYKDQKIRISGFVKHGGDFVDMAGYVAEVTGNKEVFPLSKNINEKVHRFIHKYADTVLSIHKKHNKSIKGITEETYKLLTKYFVTGKMDKSLTANKGLMTLVNDLDNIREYTKPIVRKHRVSQYFANRLRLTDFHPSQRKQLKQWETDYGEDFKAQNERWDKFMDRVEKGTEKGINNFIRENYLLEDKKYLKLHILDENIFEKESDVIGIGKGFLKSKKVQGFGEENPIEKIFYSYRRALRLEYLDESLNKINKIFKDNVIRSDYEKIKNQLKLMIGIHKDLSQVERSVRFLMGRLFMGSVVSSGMIQLKNKFQALLNAETPSDALKVLFVSRNGKKVIEKFGQKYHDRIVREMSEREAISLLVGEDVSHGLTAFSDIKHILSGQTSLVAWQIDRLTNNFMINAMANTWGKTMLNLHKRLDLENRMSGMLLWTEKTQKVLANKKLSWQQIQNRTQMNNLGLSERLFLEKVYIEQGAGEFAYQLAKMKTMAKQYEYITSLRSLGATSQNIFAKQFYQYSTWYLGFQKAVTKNLKHAILSRHRVNALKTLTTMTLTGIFTKVMLEMLTGSLPKKEDDDDLLTRMQYSGIGYFDPTDWTGSWGMSTMISPISPFFIKGIFKGKVTWKFPAEEIFLGQAGTLLSQMINSVINFYPLMLGGDKARENATKQIANTVNSYGRQILYPYVVLERFYSNFTGTRRTNLIRQLFKDVGVPYKPREVEREWFEQIQFLIAGKNIRILEKKKKPFQPKYIEGEYLKGKYIEGEYIK